MTDECARDDQQAEPLPMKLAEQLDLHLLLYCCRFENLWQRFWRILRPTRFLRARVRSNAARAFVRQAMILTSLMSYRKALVLSSSCTLALKGGLCSRIAQSSDGALH